MKKYILLLLLITANLTMLHANESIAISIEALCSDSKSVSNLEFFNSDSRREKFSITINSNRLNLSTDAIQDNTGGYVNIPEDKYYFKTDKDVYRLSGGVEYSSKDTINQFTSKIHSKSKKMINIKDFYNLTNSKNLKFIQKINLEYRGKKTNIIDVYVDKNIFDKEYQKCEEQINKSTKEFYLQSGLLILFLLGIFYLLIRRFTR